MGNWYYLAGEENKGPIAESELKDFFSNNRLPLETFVWQEGMSDWLPASQVPAFASVIVPAAPAAPAFQSSALPSVISAPPAFSFPVVLNQKVFLRGQQTFELINAQTLQFAVGRGKNQKKGQLSLGVLNPNPQRIKKWHIGSLIIAVPVILLALIVFLVSIVGLFAKLSWDDFFGFIIINGIFLLFAGLLVANAWLKRQNSLVFSSQMGALVLWFENPDKKSFDEFIASLQFCISNLDRSVQPVAPKKEAGPVVCVQCQSPQILPGYNTLLCEPCRSSLVNRPIPIALKIAAVILGILILTSAIRLPKELGASITYARAQSAEAKGDYKTAESEYQKALASYPRSLDLLSGLARSAHRAGDQDIAVKAVNQIIDQARARNEISKDLLAVIAEVKEGAKP